MSICYVHNDGSKEKLTEEEIIELFNNMKSKVRELERMSELEEHEHRAVDKRLRKLSKDYDIVLESNKSLHKSFDKVVDANVNLKKRVESAQQRADASDRKLAELEAEKPKFPEKSPNPEEVCRACKYYPCSQQVKGMVRMLEQYKDDNSLSADDCWMHLRSRQKGCEDREAVASRYGKFV